MSPPPDLQRIGRVLQRAAGRLGDQYKVTGVGMWAGSVLEEVYDLFVQMDLAAYRHLADLGSGDGRVVLVGSLFTRATGIEADAELVQISRRAAGELGLERADFIQDDCRQAELDSYDLLFMYPDKPMTWLEERLPANWPGHLVIYGPYFKPETMSFIRSIYAGTTHCTLWSR